PSSQAVPSDLLDVWQPSVGSQVACWQVLLGCAQVTGAPVQTPLLHMSVLFAPVQTLLSLHGVLVVSLTPVQARMHVPAVELPTCESQTFSLHTLPLGAQVTLVIGLHDPSAWQVAFETHGLLRLWVQSAPAPAVAQNWPDPVRTNVFVAVRVVLLQPAVTVIVSPSSAACVGAKYTTAEGSNGLVPRPRAAGVVAVSAVASEDVQVSGSMTVPPVPGQFTTIAK